jgi:hypothetical protein
LTKILKDQIGIQGNHDLASIVKDIVCNNKPCLILGYVRLASDAVYSDLLETDSICTSTVGVSIFYCCLHLTCKARLVALFGCEN